MWPRVTITAYAVGGSVCVASHCGMLSTTTSIPSPNRSELANFSRSSTTWTRKPTSCASFADEVADVPGAKHVDVRRRLHRFDEDFHLPSAHEPGFLREVVVQLVLDVQRATVRDRLAGFPERIVLIAAAADRADRPAVRVDEHLCPDALRCGPVGGDDRDERHFFPALECLRQGGENLLVHYREIIRGIADPVPGSGFPFRFHYHQELRRFLENAPTISRRSTAYRPRRAQDVFRD